jgi:hypothetical protein
MLVSTLADFLDPAALLGAGPKFGPSSKRPGTGAVTALGADSSSSTGAAHTSLLAKLNIVKMNLQSVNLGFYKDSRKFLGKCRDLGSPG